MSRLMTLGKGHRAAGTAPATWNPLDADPSISFASGNLHISQLNVGGRGGTRSTNIAGAAAKIFFRTLINNNGFTFHLNLGFANANLSLGNVQPGADASPTNACSVDIITGVYQPGSVALITACAIGDSADVAIDFGAQLFWARKVGLGWCDLLGGTQNPATGQGGVSFATGTNAGPYYAVASLFIADCTTDFSSLTGAPAGFTGL